MNAVTSMTLGNFLSWPAAILPSWRSSAPCWPIQKIDLKLEGGKALIACCEKGLVDHLKELLARSEIDINLPYKYQTPLDAACTHKHIEVAGLLLCHGADPYVSAGSSTLTTALKNFWRHPITSRLLRMTMPDTDLSYCLTLSTIMDPSLLEEVLASRLDFSRHSPPHQSNLKAIFQDYQRDRKSFRLKQGIDGNTALIFPLWFFFNCLCCLLAREAAEVFCIIVFCCDGLLQQVPVERRALPERERWSRFMNIAMRLPKELQMILCNRLEGLAADLIPRADFEVGFKFVADILRFSCLRLFVWIHRF